jgi:phage anti-repressor protein
MNEIIPIHDNNGKRTVSARQVYEFLELRQSNFTLWCKTNIVNNPYAIEGQDYSVIIVNNDNPKGGKQTSKDYELTTDFAKKIGMVTKSDKGNEIRDYFLAVEAVALNQAPPIQSGNTLQMIGEGFIAMAKQLEAAKTELRSEIADVRAHQITSAVDYYTIAGYASLCKVKLQLKQFQSFGKQASKICKDLGYATGTMPDAKYGTVKTYPDDVLKEIFEPLTIEA